MKILVYTIMKIELPISKTPILFGPPAGEAGLVTNKLVSTNLDLLVKTP